MKSIFIFLSILVLSINAHAQLLSGYGAKLGLGISNQSWNYNTNTIVDYNNKIGANPRIFADFLDLSFFNIETEISYLRKGITEKIPLTSMDQPDGTGEYINIDNSLDYLSISILAKPKYEFGIISTYILFGPQINILLGKNITKGWEVIYSKFKKSNYDLSLGAGIEMRKLLPITFLLEYRYERDFIDNCEFLNIDIKNYSHVILLGIKI